MVDWIPFLSQTKSAVQAIFGDCDGARRTQENFTRQCPGVSQIRSVVELIGGEEKTALETQREFLRVINGVVDATPLVGHAKGVVHYVVGDNEGGDNAMKSASRTTGVMAGGVGGLITAGPPGAFLGGIAGGEAMDGLITIADSAIHNEFRPHGYCQQIAELIENPADPGKWFDTVTMVVGDGVGGHAAGESYVSMKKSFEKKAIRNQFEAQRNFLVDEIGRPATKDIIEAADKMKEVRKKYGVPENKPHVTTIVRDLENNDVFVGHNKQVTDYCINQMQTDAEIMSNYSSPGEPTNLQKRVPHADPPMKRNPNTCAEQYAYHKYYKRKPHGNPKNTRATSVRFDKRTKQIRAVKRCENCLAYKDGMGTVPGDMIDGKYVPNHPGFGKYSCYKDAFLGMAKAEGGVTLQLRTGKGKNKKETKTKQK